MPAAPTALFLSHSLSPAGDISGETLLQGSFLASVRLQLRPAIEAAQELGLKPQVMALRSERPELLNGLGTPRLCVVGKLSHPNPGWQQRIAMANLAAMARLRRKRVPVAVVYSDNLASQATPVGVLYRDLLWLADLVVLPCQAMERFARPWMRPGQGLRVIEDPWQLQRQPFPLDSPTSSCRLIWFGHPSNSGYLLRCLPQLLRGCEAAQRYELTVLADPVVGKQVRRFLAEAPAAVRPWTLRPVIWQAERQPAQLQEELARAHLALLPSDPQDPRKAAVSHNRLVDALQAGCIVVASPLESYRQLAKGALLGNDLAALMNGAVREYHRLAEKYAALREPLLARFNPVRNRGQWRGCLEALSAFTVRSGVG